LPKMVALKYTTPTTGPSLVGMSVIDT